MRQLMPTSAFLEFFNNTLLNQRESQEYVVTEFLNFQSCSQGKFLKSFDLATCHSNPNIQIMLNTIGLIPFYIKLGTLVLPAAAMSAKKISPDSRYLKSLESLVEINQSCYVFLMLASGLKKLLPIAEYPLLSELAKRPFTEELAGFPSGHFAAILPLLIISIQGSGNSRIAAGSVSLLILSHRLLTGAHTPAQLLVTGMTLLPAAAVLDRLKKTPVLPFFAMISTATDILLHPGVGVIALPALALIARQLKQHESRWGIFFLTVAKSLLMMLQMLCPEHMANNIFLCLLATYSFEIINNPRQTIVEMLGVGLTTMLPSSMAIPLALVFLTNCPLLLSKKENGGTHRDTRVEGNPNLPSPSCAS